MPIITTVMFGVIGPTRLVASQQFVIGHYCLYSSECQPLRRCYRFCRIACTYIWWFRALLDGILWFRSYSDTHVIGMDCRHPHTHTPEWIKLEDSEYVCKHCDRSGSIYEVSDNHLGTNNHVQILGAGTPQVPANQIGAQVWELAPSCTVGSPGPCTDSANGLSNSSGDTRNAGSGWGSWLANCGRRTAVVGGWDNRIIT